MRKKVPYITKADLIRLRSYESDAFHFDRALTDDYIDKLDPTVKLPVVDHLMQDQDDGPFGQIVVARVILPKQGRHTRGDDDFATGLVDMPPDEFLSLPEA